jgi:ketosteroid isomerase-like protein
MAGTFGATAMPLVAQAQVKGEASKVAAVRAEIAANNVRFLSAIRNRDAAALGAMYTEDVEILPSDRPKIKGRQAAAAFFLSAPFDPSVTGNLVTVDLVVAGDTAVEVGQSIRKKPDAAGVMTTVSTSKYIVIWKRQQGVWKTWRDIFNRDAPAPPPVTP